MESNKHLFCKECNDFIKNPKNELKKGHNEILIIPSFVIKNYELKQIISSDGFGITRSKG